MPDSDQEPEEKDESQADEEDQAEGDTAGTEESERDEESESKPTGKKKPAAPKKSKPVPLPKPKTVVIQITEDNTVTVNQGKDNYCCRSLWWICCFVFTFIFCCIGAIALVETALLLALLPLVKKLFESVRKTVKDVNEKKQ